jgi:PAS domain S-box-containing protein
MVAILGYDSKEELLAIDIKKELYFDPSERDSLTLNEMREELGIFRLRKKDGSEIWVEDHGWYTLSEGGETLYHEGVIRDVTARIKAEDALHESELVHLKLIERIPDGVYKTTHDGKFVEVNPAMVSMLGYESKEALLAIDIKTQLYFDPDDRESIILEQKQNEIGNYRLRKKDGSEMWVEDHGWYTMDENGKILFHEGVMRDITDRKNAEEELKESQLLFQNITLVSPSGIFRSTVDGYTTYVNPQWSELSGLSFDEAVGYGWLNAVHPDDRERVSENWLTDVSRNKPSTAEYRFLKPDGSIVYVIGYAVPEIKDNIINGFIGTITDITERKLAEEEIISLNATLEQRVIHRTAQLEAANKELEAFSYTISHDLRTPLRALDGFANFLLEDYSKVLDVEGKRLLQVIIDNANKMGFLIDDLLAFSKLSRYKLDLTQIDMQSMAISVYQELATTSDKESIDFRLQNIPDAFGDPSMIRQVWLNLISNAIKYTSKKQNRVIEVLSVNEGSENIYIVKDNGAGFNMEYYDKMFGVFHRLHTTKDFEGTGIGLAIVKRIVTRHHGRIWAKGEVGEGATFSFTISNKP